MKRAAVRLRLTCLQLWKQTWSWSLKQEDEDLTLQHENIMHLKKPHHNSDNESSDMMMQTMLTKKTMTMNDRDGTLMLLYSNCTENSLRLFIEVMSLEHVGFDSSFY